MRLQSRTSTSILSHVSRASGFHVQIRKMPVISHATEPVAIKPVGTDPRSGSNGVMQVHTVIVDLFHGLVPTYFLADFR